MYFFHDLKKNIWELEVGGEELLLIPLPKKLKPEVVASAGSGFNPAFLLTTGSLEC